MNPNLKARLAVILSHLEETMRPGAATVMELMDEHEGLERSLESTQCTVDALHEHLSAERDNAFLDASALANLQKEFDSQNAELAKHIIMFDEAMARAEKAESENAASRETADGLRGALAAEEITHRRTIAALEKAEADLTKAEELKTWCPDCGEDCDLDEDLSCTCGAEAIVDLDRVQHEHALRVEAEAENAALKARIEKSHADEVEKKMEVGNE